MESNVFVIPAKRKKGNILNKEEKRNLGFQFRFKQGKISVNHNRFLGYTKDENGNLVIEPTEAKTIKRIFLEFLEGASLRDIAKGLEKDNILTGAGRKKWIPSSARRILTNEKYMGDALLQKTYTIDFLNKTRVKNDGIVPQYYVQDSHEAIIPKNIFMKAQEELIEEKNEIILKEAENKNLKERLKEMNEFLEEKEIRMDRFDDVLVRKLIEEIEINGDTILVEFKSGIKVEVK